MLLLYVESVPAWSTRAMNTLWKLWPAASDRGPVYALSISYTLLDNHSKINGNLPCTYELGDPSILHEILMQRERFE